MSFLDYILSHSPILYFTQSLWRDEAFSVLVASRPLSAFIGKLAFETPLYYIVLHYWMKLFGTTELAVRSLSLVAFALATVVMIFWAESMFKKHWLSWYVPILFFTNPMLLYYAFEARFYGWVIFLSTLSLYAFTKESWRLWIVATILGFYTHTYFLFIPFVQVIYYLRMHSRLLKQKNWALAIKDPFMGAGAISLLCMSPWLLKIAAEASRLKQSWYYPVDLKLVTSVLGNMFIGYEGTPWYVWQYMPFVTLGFLFIFYLAMKNSHRRQRNLYILLTAIVPLIVVVGISFIKPLFVNRYFLYVTIAQVLLIAYAIENISHELTKKAVAAIILGLVVWVNFWYPAEHKKLPIRDTIMEINLLRGPKDVILAKSPLIFFESIYYSGDPSKVFLYNPEHSPFPWYVGDMIVSAEQMVEELPPYPIRAFLVSDDGSYTIAYQTDTLARRK